MVCFVLIFKNCVICRASSSSFGYNLTTGKGTKVDALISLCQFLEKQSVFFKNVLQNN